jgi:hypothetical protein
VEDFALSIIEGTEDTVFAVGACWHGKLNLISHQSGFLIYISIIDSCVFLSKDF